MHLSFSSCCLSGVWWPFLCCHTMDCVCLNLAINPLFSSFQILMAYYTTPKKTQNPCFESELFLELWNWDFYFFSLSHVSQVVILESETSTSSDPSFFFTSAFRAETCLNRLPGSFILPTSLSYLRKVLIKLWGKRGITGRQMCRNWAEMVTHPGL